MIGVTNRLLRYRSALQSFSRWTCLMVIGFITDYAVIDKIIHHLGVTFTAERSPPPTRQEEP